MGVAEHDERGDALATLGSGTPIAAASTIRSSFKSAASISAGPIRRPETLIVSSERPCTRQVPSSSTEARSPWTQTPSQRSQ